MYRMFVSTILAALSAASLHAEDQIFRKGQSPEKGLISKMTKTMVTLTASGVDREFAANEILRINFEDEPQELSNVRRDVAADNYRSAFDDLKKIDSSKISREVVRQEVEYLNALCKAKLAMTEGGDKAAAETALREFCTKAKDNYRSFPAAELLGDVAASAGKYAEAAKYYNAVTQAPWDETRIRANVALGRALASQGDFAKALEKFDAVQKDVDTAETASLKQLAAVGRAVCLAETDKAAEAIELIRGEKGVIATNDPKDGKLMSRAYNALGVALVKAGKDKDAVLAFLHTDLLYFQEPDAHAEALYYLAGLWPKVNKADRAIEAQNTLKQRYAGSVWATKK